MFALVNLDERREKVSPASWSGNGFAGTFMNFSRYFPGINLEALNSDGEVKMYLYWENEVPSVQSTY